MKIDIGWNIIEGVNGDPNILRWGIGFGWQADRTFRIDNETADLILKKTMKKVPVMIKKMVSLTTKNEAGEDVVTEQEQEVQAMTKNEKGEEIPQEVDGTELAMTIDKALGIEKEKIQKAKEAAEAKKKRDDEEDAKKAKVVKK